MKSTLDVPTWLSLLTHYHSFWTSMYNRAAALNFSLVVIMFSISAYVMSLHGLSGVALLWILTLTTKITYEWVKHRWGFRGFWVYVFIFFIIYGLISQLYFLILPESPSGSTEAVTLFIILILLLSATIMMFHLGISQIFVSRSISHRLDSLILLITQGTLSDSKTIAFSYRAVFEVYLDATSSVLANFAFLMAPKSWKSLILMSRKEREEVLLEWAVNTGGMTSFSSYSKHRDAWKKTPGFLKVTKRED